MHFTGYHYIINFLSVLNNNVKYIKTNIKTNIKTKGKKKENMIRRLKQKPAVGILIVIGLLSCVTLFLTNPPTASASGPSSETAPEVKIPSVVFTGKLDLKEIAEYDRVFVNGEEINTGWVEINSQGKIDIKIIKNNKEYKYKTFAIEGFLTILPPFLAIALALLFKDVLIALFIGIFSGALLVGGYDVLGAFFRVMDKYVLDAVADSDRASIIIFTLMLGGMVGIITKSGGVRGVVESVARRVKSPRGTQFYTWLMGILIFFDDYTNTLVVGNTMRPLSDKWKISREKLAYIVDSTAAPIACIAMISTWIGFEISLINQQLEKFAVDTDAYHLFLSSLPYRFYPILAMIFVVLVFTMRKDFGPMLKAENRARAGKLLNDAAVPLSDFESSGLNPDEKIPPRWYNALIPIFVVIGVTFVGLYISGNASLTEAMKSMSPEQVENITNAGFIQKLGTIISKADSFKVLLWSSFMGVFVAMLLAWSQRILKLRETVSSLVQGMKSMMMAIIILVMAWSLGVVLGELRTADFLVYIVEQIQLPHQLFPAIVFIFSGFIAFSTGTSWGTIAIMYPLVIPIIITLLRSTPDFEHLLTLTISSVLAGAVFGDHCSPISDTTIMSSMASSCDHIDHVKTQLPYALLIAVIALGIGIIPVSFGFPYFLSLGLSVGTAALVLLFFGKRPVAKK